MIFITWKDNHHGNLGNVASSLGCYGFRNIHSLHAGSILDVRCNIKVRKVGKIVGVMAYSYLIPGCSEIKACMSLCCK